MMVFTPENPRGERREILESPLESPLSPQQRRNIEEVRAAQED